MISTNTFDLHSLKSIADSHRALLPENSHFGIRELLNKPVFLIGWSVDLKKILILKCF